MAEGFRADAERLAGRAGEFADLAERSGAIHRELADRLAAVGECWGADRVGESFAAAHLGPAEATLGELGALPGRLDDVGGRFADTARGYADGEAATVRGLQASGE